MLPDFDKMSEEEYKLTLYSLNRKDVIASLTLEQSTNLTRRVVALVEEIAENTGLSEEDAYARFLREGREAESFASDVFEAWYADVKKQRETE